MPGVRPQTIHKASLRLQPIAFNANQDQSNSPCNEKRLQRPEDSKDNWNPVEIPLPHEPQQQVILSIIGELGGIQNRNWRRDRKC